MLAGTAQKAAAWPLDLLKGNKGRKKGKVQMGTRVLLHIGHQHMGWVLLLSTLVGALATKSKRNLGPLKVVAMDMASSAFDDQYRGCSRMMEDLLGELNRTEFTNQVYAETWRIAAKKVSNRWGRANRSPALRWDQATAVMAYKMETKLYHQFNEATRRDGTSRQHYLRSFPFKTLHFLLTRALQTLWESQPQRCHHIYRGVSDTRFTAQPGTMVRFGHFTSTSLQREVSESFGQDTFFSLVTCHGVPIKEFSDNPEEDEVLIPPFEQFMVTNFIYTKDGTFIELHSKGVNSTYNCEFVKDKWCKEGPCAFIAGRSSPMEPQHLWVLLVAVTALAAIAEP